uniref:VWFA domain-containing protein n=1 Tax=Panagrolaimus sp. JU765 TaxID=591449 RepID=A0AC34RLJ1_9BILA
MSDDEASWMKETVMNEESSWTREKEKPSSSSKKSSVKFSSKTVEEIQSREKNKRLRAIFEDENLDYGKDATTKEELEEKFKKALSIREKQIGQVLRLIGQARFVQLCFLIDATGSMQPHIDGVKDSIKKIVNVLLEQRYNQEAIVKKMQLAMVAYRDYNDKKQFEELQFTDSVEDFKTFCQRIEANGGGDACEDVLGGLDHALKV